ncbi:hypothetical protein KC19_VG316900 [Ceratodon purpureus]|uniref:Uncharacterized protein n=1 Tax=Ceratodon purpureus TaxID=3225 RepID=A0A8T0HWN3_CERPU|nr:hypothetical protein KC19_VG316900 [Ceratodon purpureus]
MHLKILLRLPWLVFLGIIMTSQLDTRPFRSAVDDFPEELAGHPGVVDIMNCASLQRLRGSVTWRHTIPWIHRLRQL